MVVITGHYEKHLSEAPHCGMPMIPRMQDHARIWHIHGFYIKVI